MPAIMKKIIILPSLIYIYTHFACIDYSRIWSITQYFDDVVSRIVLLTHLKLKKYNLVNKGVFFCQVYNPDRIASIMSPTISLSSSIVLNALYRFNAVKHKKNNPTKIHFVPNLKSL